MIKLNKKTNKEYKNEKILNISFRRKFNQLELKEQKIILKDIKNT